MVDQRTGLSLAVSGLGVLFALSNAVHAALTENTLAVVVVDVFPATLAVGLVLAGYRLFRSGWETPRIRRVAGWYGATAVLVGGISALVLEAHAAVHGQAIHHSFVIHTNAGIVGGIAGLLIGVYDADRRESTERLRTRERELAETNTILSTVMENLPTGVVAEDASRTVVAANSALFEVLDVPDSPEEVVGRDCGRVAEEASERFADPAGFVARIDEVLDRREPVHGEELRLDDGRTVERTYVPYRLSGGEANLWLYRDVTERKQHEEELRALHEATREFVTAEGSSELAEGMARAAKETLGYPFSVVRLVSEDGTTLEPVAITEEARELLGERPVYEVGEGPAGRAFQRGEPVVVDDLRELDDEYDRKRGRSGMFLPIGGYGVVGIGHEERSVFDDSDVRIASILTANAEVVLDRLQGERELQRQNERLEGFASVVSHDLRSPLSVASGYLALAREECDSEHLDDVDQALERMETLVEDLLRLARSGDEVTDRDSVGLSETVASSWRTVDAPAADLEVEVSGTVRADETRLRQVFENLFRNAVEHAGEHVTVTVGRLPDGLYVEDDGPGIPEGDRERIFEVGYSTAADGTGLGMNIVQDVVETFGWTIRVTEGTDGGARFEITDMGLES